MNIVAYIAAFAVMLIPYTVGAQPLVPDCEGAGCTFGNLVDFAQNLIDWMLRIAIPIATVLFSYAGFLYLTSAESPGQRSKAKGIFFNVFIGLVIALAAWIMVSFITRLLIDPSSGINPNPDEILR